MEYNTDTTRPAAKKDSAAALLRVIAALCAAMLLVLIVCAAVLAPKLSRAADMTAETMGLLGESLEGRDLGSVLDDASLLLEESRDGVSQAAEKIEQLDIESLNSAISDLNRIVSPLAKLFGGG